MHSPGRDPNPGDAKQSSQKSPSRSCPARLPRGKQSSEFFILISFACSRISGKLSYVVGTLLCLTSFSRHEGFGVRCVFGWIGVQLISLLQGRFDHPPTDGHIGCFQFFHIMNKFAMNILLQVILWTCFHFS